RYTDPRYPPHNGTCSSAAAAIGMSAASVQPPAPIATTVATTARAWARRKPSATSPRPHRCCAGSIQDRVSTTTGGRSGADEVEPAAPQGLHGPTVAQ